MYGCRVVQKMISIIPQEEIKVYINEESKFININKNRIIYLSSNNEYKSPHNYNLKNFSSNYNMDEDTFKSYGLENTKGLRILCATIWMSCDSKNI